MAALTGTLALYVDAKTIGDYTIIILLRGVVSWRTR